MRGLSLYPTAGVRIKRISRLKTDSLSREERRRVKGPEGLARYKATCFALSKLYTRLAIETNAFARFVRIIWPVGIKYLSYYFDNSILSLVDAQLSKSLTYLRIVR